MESTLGVTQEAVFIGANKQSHVLDYLPDLVAYGAGRSIALWHPLCKAQKGVFQTLNGHQKEVTCVRFVPGSDLLVSAGEDGQILTWKKIENSESGGYRRALGVAVENSSITTLAAADSSILVSGSSLGDIVIWRLHKDNLGLSLAHSFHVESGFLPTTLSVQMIDSTYLLLVGGTSADLFVYSFTELGTDCALCAVLAGHEDWIKCLAMVPEREGLDYILASGSQDRYIRLWRLRLNEAIDDSDEDEHKLALLLNKQYKFDFGSGRAAFSFEALIMGHDDWVTGLTWHPSYTKRGVKDDQEGSKKLQLLSLSADTVLIVWEMDPDSGIWVTATRLGELSIKGASTATGASGGFWACIWFADPVSHVQYILASCRKGAVRVFQNTHPATNAWESVLGVTGPVRAVTDIVWSPEGTFFLATSLDQTTRLIAPWTENRHVQKVTWHEFARPQIHGYDMVCASFVSPTQFVSGGDEKILRVFEMTHAINRMLRKFCGIDDFSVEKALPESASLPALGLSNKAANEQLGTGEAQQREEDCAQNDGETTEKRENADVLLTLMGPPLEDHLQRHTLFPELEKLYGHGYEITCCATSPAHSFVASACRSNCAKHAVIRIFDATRDFQLVDQVLKGHNFTIVSLAFSPCGGYLSAVSRDRQSSLWLLVDVTKGHFELVELNPKAHSRIIWDCSWAPAGTRSFVTGSRDKFLKMWRLSRDSAEVEKVSQIKTEFAITSVACYQKELVNEKVLIGVGHENGHISVYAVFPIGTNSVKKVLDFGSEISPGSRIHKLAFSTKTIGGQLQLAVGSDDTSIRVYYVDTKNF